ncbi:MAG TPA: lipoyl(octanoyl) transferase LipB, partial [Burkholderiales bacterium]|nr:lipoyl(octanoyl) transferase LipB [Burkholderiales bacterium]
PDELWLLEHPPVYTLGVRARHRLLQPSNAVPVVTTDRGGDVTYHGPGQPIIYALLDLARRGLGIHALVGALEQAVIDMLADLGLAAERHPGAPGVYLADRKIASLGLRVRAGRSYHGLAFNARMDLAPFHAIDPCGYPGLRMTQLSEWRSDIDADEAGERLLRQVRRRLAYTETSIHSTKTNDVAYWFDARG